jgi:hypothetical protein
MPVAAPISAETRAAAAQHAAEIIANRDKRDAWKRLLDAILEHLQALLGVYGAVNFDANHQPLDSGHSRRARELIDQLQEVNVELARYDDRLRGREEWRECALDGEMVEKATERLLLELGASSYQIVRAGGADSAFASDSAARKSADRRKRARREQLEHQLSAPNTVSMLLEITAMKAGLAPSPDHALRWRTATQETIARLSSERRSPSRKRTKRQG